MILDDISFAEDVPQYILSLIYSPLTDDCVFRARDTLFDAVHPLFRAIGSYANCYVSLIIGNADMDKVDREFFTV